MSSTDPNSGRGSRPGDRRHEDRRADDLPTAVERRESERRSGEDRRHAPRVRLLP